MTKPLRSRPIQYPTAFVGRPTRNRLIKINDLSSVIWIVYSLMHRVGEYHEETSRNCCL
jgi:hypothetical protein